MGSINVDCDDEKNQYFVTGTNRDGEFVISGPWTSRGLAETHAKKIIAIFNEAAAKIVKDAKDNEPKIILQ